MIEHTVAERWLMVGDYHVPTIVTVPPRWASASGYGRRIPTAYMIRAAGSRRWRRVYCCCFSNVGTCYIDGPDGKWIVVST